jgi:hypothetical protein
MHLSETRVDYHAGSVRALGTSNGASESPRKSSVREFVQQEIMKRWPKSKRIYKVEDIKALLTPEQMKLFADGARQLFGSEYTHSTEERAPRPKKKRGGK